MVCTVAGTQRSDAEGTRAGENAYILLGFLTTTMSIGGNAMVMVLKWRIRDEKFFIIL